MSAAPFPGGTRTLREVTDELGVTPRAWVSFGFIAVVLLMDGMDVTIVSHVFPSLVKEWGVSVAGGVTIVVAGGAIAMGVGALAAGRLADRWGRKRVIVAAGIVLAVPTMLGATAADLTAFTAWRLLACLGIGAVMPTAVTLLADLVPERRRAGLITAAYAAVGLGTTVGAVLAGLVIPVGGWRTLLVIAGALPLLFILALAVVVPESPAFLVGRGQIARAARSLERLAPRLDTSTVAFVVTNPAAEAGALRTIVTPPYRVTTLLLWVFGFFSLGTQLMIAQYLPTLLQLQSPGLSTVQSSTVVGVYGLAAVIGAVVLGGVLVRVSRFVAIGGSLALATVVTIVVGVFAGGGFIPVLALLALAGLVLPTAFGPTRNALAAPAYPTALRGTGVGSTELAARTGSAVGGVVGGLVIGAGGGLTGVFLIVLVPLGVLAVTLAGVAHQTRPEARAVARRATTRGRARTAGSGMAS